MENEDIVVEDYEETQNEFEDTDDLENIPYETAIKWREDLKKASKKIAEFKKQSKETPQVNENYITKDELEIEKFITRNPELEEYKEELNKYKKLGLSLDKAKLLIENDDKTIENRKKTNSMNITNSEDSAKTTYTKADLENMSQSEYNKIKALIESGKATLRK